MADIKKCPECESDKITELTTYEGIVGRNIKTGKVIYRDKKVGKGFPIHWCYMCRKCNWVSETFTE